MNPSGKVAIVTGSGGGGTGRSAARRFAREGASVVVSDVNDAGGHETVALIEAEGGRAAFCHTDVRIESDVKVMIAFAESAFGGLDYLVNNASNPDGMGLLTGWTNAVAIEILGPMHATLAAIEAMRRRGGGAIVNIGSTSALGHGRKHSCWPAYDVGKMAQMRLTTTLALPAGSGEYSRQLSGPSLDCISRTQGILGESHAATAQGTGRAGHVAVAG